MGSVENCIPDLIEREVLIDLSGGKARQNFSDSSRSLWWEGIDCQGLGVSYSYGYSRAKSGRHFRDYFIIWPQAADTLTSPICEMMGHNCPRWQFVSCYGSWFKQCTSPFSHWLLLLGYLPGSLFLLFQRSQ